MGGISLTVVTNTESVMVRYTAMTKKVKAAKVRLHDLAS